MGENSAVRQLAADVSIPPHNAASEKTHPAPNSARVGCEVFPPRFTARASGPARNRRQRHDRLGADGAVPTGRCRRGAADRALLTGR
eukprot:815726-Pyramimonas_sp.AAC.2